MAKHKAYSAIIQAVKSGKLDEPISLRDFRRASPIFGEGTYNAFLHKHRKDNPGGQSELFELVAPGKFRLLRPIRYGL